MIEIRRLLCKYRMLVVRELRVRDELIQAYWKDLANGQDRFSPSPPETRVLENLHQVIDRLIRDAYEEICGCVEAKDEKAELIEACQKVVRHSWPDCDPDAIRDLEHLRCLLPNAQAQRRPPGVPCGDQVGPS
jgi:hypothetical protein